MAAHIMARRLAAILAADVVGYSRLMGACELETVARPKALRTDVVDPLLGQHGGEIIDTAGDSVVAVFGSAGAAVECALAIQERLTERDLELPDADRMRLRIGVNLGDLIVDGDALYGDGINVAARLEALAEPGGVLIADEVHRLIGADLGKRFLGARRLPSLTVLRYHVAGHDDVW